MTEDKKAFQKFFQAALEGGWGLLQHYMCRPMPRDRHANMTGGGLGNVFGALQRPGVPLSLYTSTTQVGGNMKKTDDTKKRDDKKICIKMVNPTEQSLDQAKSELRRDRELEQELAPRKKKMKRHRAFEDELEPRKKKAKVVHDIRLK